MTILEEARRIFSHRASEVFLIDAATGRMFTYQDCQRLAGVWARALRVRGLGKGQRIAILLPNSPEFALAYLACLMSGIVAVPIPLSLHHQDIEFILKHSGASLIVCSPETDLSFDRARIGRHGITCWSMPRVDATACEWQVGIGEYAPFSNFEGVTPDDLAAIVFTSGTSSRPSGVAHRLGALLENARAFDHAIGIGPDNRFLHVLPMGYMAGFLNTLLCPLMAGASVVLASAFDAQSALTFWPTAMRHRADTFWLTPTMLATLLGVDRDPAVCSYSRRYVRAVCVGTAPLPLKIKRTFERKYGVELLESYGLSELLFVSGNSPNIPSIEGSSGLLLPGVEIRIVGEQGELLGTGQDGEMQVRTPYMMAGYLDDASLPDPTTAPEWFATGDVGHLDRVGNLFITARMKDLIIRGGINVSPRAVEEALLEHEAVAKVAVIGLAHPFYGEEVVAVVQLRPEYTLEGLRSSLDAFCRERLSPVATPTQFVQLESFPVGATGKIQKHKLREQLLDRLAASSGPVASGDDRGRSMPRA